jgi:hypothetical protein
MAPPKHQRPEEQTVAPTNKPPAQKPSAQAVRAAKLKENLKRRKAAAAKPRAEKSKDKPSG